MGGVGKVMRGGVRRVMGGVRKVMRGGIKEG